MLESEASLGQNYRVSGWWGVFGSSSDTFFIIFCKLGVAVFTLQQFYKMKVRLVQH